MFMVDISVEGFIMLARNNLEPTVVLVWSMVDSKLFLWLELLVPLERLHCNTSSDASVCRSISIFGTQELE